MRFGAWAGRLGVDDTVIHIHYTLLHAVLLPTDFQMTFMIGRRSCHWLQVHLLVGLAQHSFRQREGPLDPTRSATAAACRRT